MSPAIHHEASIHPEASRTRSGPSLSRVLPAVIVLGACGVLAIRLALAAELPLWLDETWSAMIATRPAWSSFWREAWLDCNAPLYYFLLSLWVSIAGDSNLILRLPSFLFVTASALAPLIWRPRGLNSTGVWTWAALILLWGPGVFVMIDARPYGLLLLLSTLSCLAVARLHQSLTLRAAAVWVGLCTLMFLTHYFAAMLIAGQALVLLHRHRLALIKVWPAGLIGIPGLAWFFYHLPRLMDYARPDVVWYTRTTLTEALGYLRFVLGGESAMFVPLIVAILLFGLLTNRGENGPGVAAEPVSAGSLWAVALAGAIGLSLAILMGMFQASLTSRYLVPFVPAVMLAIVLMTQRFVRQQSVSLFLVIAFLLPGLNFAGTSRAADQRYSYGYEKGSEFLSAYRPTDLVFAWDHPASKILDRRSLAEVGAYFLKRGGHEVATTAVILRETDDPNAILDRAAEGRRPAIIWLYNTARRSAVRLHPPVLQARPEWKCQHHRRPSGRTSELGAIACIKVDQSDA